LEDRKPYLFIEYAPRIFKQIRERFGISNKDYMVSFLLLFDNKFFKSSLSPDMFHKIQEKMSTQGRSGSFFFFSHDKRLLIKTLPEGELDMLMSILPDYHKV
jgi:1-phosphatidylinositol-4-phosphate 5-kinase